MCVVLRRAREDSRIAGRGILQSKRGGGLLEGSPVNPSDGGREGRTWRRWGGRIPFPYWAGFSQWKGREDGGMFRMEQE